jgi:pentatricopeptide repeat protein
MSLGSRILQRGRTALSANLASTPREPLLFLYPQWAGKFSTAADAASSQDGGLPVRSTQPNIPRQPLPPKPASTSDDDLSLQQRFDKPKAEPLKPFSSPHTAATAAAIEAVFATSDDFPRNLTEDPSDNKEPSIVERQVRKILQTEVNARKNELTDRKVRSAYNAWRRETLRSWVPDWRVILAVLNQHTPQHGKWLHQALELIIPLESLPQLVHGIDDFILDIGFQYGVSIRVCEWDEDSKLFRRFIISGPATSISKTTAEVLRIAPTTVMKTASSLIAPSTDDLALETTLEREASLTNPLNEPEIEIRYNFTESQPRKLKLPPAQIPRPGTWTHVSFLDYVRVLTASRVSNHLNRFGFRTAQEHSAAVTEILRSLFNDPECKDVISRTACNEAMQYFVKKNRLEEARVLFVRMEMLKMPLVPETFNIMLRGAAKNDDLHNFHFILHLMLRRGITPNGYTWLAFMKAHPDVRVKLHILTAMKAKGLTAHPSIMKEVCSQLIQPEIDSSLEQNLSHAQFVAHMDSRYGPDWLSLESGNRALHSLGARGLISRCWEFLNFMSSRFIPYDNYSINIILHHCKQATNLTGAVELLRSLPYGQAYHFVPDEETYRIMFELAWRSRSYNLAKVIWRYACLAAETTFTMRNRVFTSMLYASSKDTRATPRERWKQYAGPVIFGANHHGEHPAHFWAKIYSDENSANSIPALDQTNQGDDNCSEPPSHAKDTKVLFEETPRQESLHSEESENDKSKKEALEDEIKDGTQSDKSDLGNSTAESAGTAATNNCLEGKHDVKNNRFAVRLQKFTPIGILDPEESVAENQMQLWYQTRAQLRRKLEQDLEIHKEWRPVQTFSLKVVEALERDMEWRENGHYAEMDMHTLMRNALSISIVTKNSSSPRRYMWK